MPHSEPIADPADAERSFALEVVRDLRAAGHEALWAGGCVRDQLLGKRPKDYDVATSATPDEVRGVFGKRRTIPVGAAFGVITVLGRKPASEAPTPSIEVATFRTDGGYADGRRPESVRFSNAEEDATRRDFTINGLFFDPIEAQVIDYVGGEADLRARIVRAIGDPDARIGEDRLRMLRAVRFAASLGFELDPVTAEAVRRHAGAITDVSPERIGAEVKRMLTESDPTRAVVLLHETGLVERVLPEVTPFVAEVVDTLSRLEGPVSPALGLATPLAGRVSADVAARRARALKWTNKECDRVAWLVDNWQSLRDAASSPWSATQPLLAHHGGAELVRLAAALGAADDASLRFCQDRLAWPIERLDPLPLVSGADLIAAGKKPGPEFSALLARARAAQLDGEAGTRGDALRVIGL